MTWFERPPTAPEVPLIVSIPHTGTEIPPELASRLQVPPLSDTDWHLHHLYDFAPGLGAVTLFARYGRVVVDLNRPHDGQALYPGRDETTLVPTSTFAGERLYRPGDEPSAAEIAERLDRYWRPYHSRILDHIDRLRARFGFVVLFDAHSIVSEVPRFFPGRLDCLVLGDDDGRAAAPWVREALEGGLGGSGIRIQVNHPFRGGTITRSYGAPEIGVHAIQLEMGQSLYMDERAPETWDPDAAHVLRSVLRKGLARLVDEIAKQ